MFCALSKIGNVAYVGALCLCLVSGPVAANDADTAHRLAHQFANAHENEVSQKPTHDSIEPEQVEGAIQRRKHETEFKTTDQILNSVEARTKAIEDLLRKSELAAWDAETYVSEPQATERDRKSRDAVDASPSAPVPDRDAQQHNDPDVFDLPEPSYALGGPATLRSGLTEASELMTSATVLLKIKPGNKGLRRFKKTADPVLCGRRHCYMSQGADRDAQRMHRGAALGPFNTLGRRAGACRQRLICTFRNVDVAEHGVLLQPVDLKYMRHDRRAYRSVKPDPTCKIRAGRLHCAKPVEARSWTAWIVPEHLANQAGREVLEIALEEGLSAEPPTTYARSTER